MNISLPLPLDASRQSGFTTPLRLLLATTAAFWMGTAQSHVVTTLVRREVTELRFREFFRPSAQQAGLEISDTLRQAHGQTVRLVGYMVQQKNPVPGRFLLTPHPLQADDHGDSDTTQLPPSTVAVQLDQSQQDWAVPHVCGLVTVSGRLSLNHEMPHGRASWVHVQLGPQATRSVSASELTGYLHSLRRRQPPEAETRRLRVQPGAAFPTACLTAPANS